MKVEPIPPIKDKAYPDCTETLQEYYAYFTLTAT